MKYSIGIVSFSLFISLLTGGCNKNVHQNHSDNVTLGYDGTAVLSALPMIAEAHKSSANKSTNYVTFTSGRDAAQALIAGRVDVATVADFPVVLALAQHPDLRIVGSIAESGVGDAFVGRKSRGISSLRDLRGKKIGLSIGAAPQYLIEIQLQKLGIDPREYTEVNLDPGSLVPALIHGDVDAVCSWQPNLYNAQKALGSDGIFLADKSTYSLTYNLVTTQEYIEHHSELLRNLLQEMNLAASFIQTNPDTAHQIVSQKTGIEASALKSFWHDYRLALFWDTSTLTTMREEEKWALTAKLLPDLSRSLNFDQVPSLDLLSSLSRKTEGK